MLFEHYLRDHGYEILHSCEDPEYYGQGEAVGDEYRVRYSRRNGVEIGVLKDFDRWSNSRDFYITYVPVDIDSMDVLFSLVRIHMDLGDYLSGGICNHVDLTGELHAEMGMGVYGQ